VKSKTGAGKKAVDVVSADDRHRRRGDQTEARSRLRDLRLSGRQHGFCSEARASFNAEATAIAWARTIRFLDKAMGK
jgi:dienelactone hydrolase